jgi:hypothetical protein
MRASHRLTPTAFPAAAREQRFSGTFSSATSDSVGWTLAVFTRDVIGRSKGLFRS